MFNQRKNGSEIYTVSGHYSTVCTDAITIADTVGAGDAYSAMLAACYFADWPSEDILVSASDFSARICEIKGALPVSGEFYNIFRNLFK